MQATSSAIFSPESWTELLSFEKLFPSRFPLEIEIGCGKGRFLTARASSHPTINFLGIDKLLKRLKKTDKKITLAGLTNVRLIKIDAAYAFEKLLPESSVSTLYIFFPDPWPKRRHHGRRLFSKEFMDSLFKVIIPEGHIYMATDHIEYSEWIRKLFDKDPRFTEIPHLEPEEHERTEFETLFLSQGVRIARLGFKKNAS
ncbi:MAG: tRNA (guanosine(46)-N7)-methyltransferase TrmB [Lentisphaerae bacterium RIFOXYA12_FULL_48_11]|nr:MAG: tRNA (guanosine(46)-N7)-methyltransferase TrmB [Lentisphaerae bacterium RIFOXYA12_FULL_48_11]